MPVPLLVVRRLSRNFVEFYHVISWNIMQKSLAVINDAENVSMLSVVFSYISKDEESKEEKKRKKNSKRVEMMYMYNKMHDILNSHLACSQKRL
jgi:hypothetical protein